MSAADSQTTAGDVVKRLDARFANDGKINASEVLLAVAATSRHPTGGMQVSQEKSQTTKSDAEITSMATTARLHRQVNERYDARRRPRPPAGSVGAPTQPVSPVSGGSAE